MPKATLISPVSKQGIQLIRVAAYCRVSSSSADQLNSYATQIDYYTKLAKKKKAEWNMVEIFADEGISGMKAKNRPEFQRMIRMCELHQIDLIVTKSVSRFARNVKEALEYVRSRCRLHSRRGRRPPHISDLPGFPRPQQWQGRHSGPGPDPPGW